MQSIKTIIVLLSLVLGGCSYIYGDSGLIKNRETDYLKARSVPPLRIPPGMSSSTIQAHYPVSDDVYPSGTQKLSLVPPELNSSGK